MVNAKPWRKNAFEDPTTSAKVKYEKLLGKNALVSHHFL